MTLSINSPVYQGSIYSLVQQAAVKARSTCFVIATTSAHGGSGVTYVSRLLVDSLNHDLPGGAVAIDCRRLSRRDGIEPGFSCSNVNEKGDSLALGGWRGSPEFRASYIEWFRERYSYVVLDCPPISESSEVLGLSSVVDGIISIVEADRTTKVQISYLERSVEQSGGTLLGHVLNKRTYLIPRWLNLKLERSGI